MISLPVLSILVTVLAAYVMCAAYFSQKRWEAKEEKWREREMALVDRLLKQGHIPAVEIERERVVKLPDPEIQPPTWIDQAFFIDEIKEELEQVYPEAARMSHSEAEQRYPYDWRAIQQRLHEEKTPLRAG